MSFVTGRDDIEEIAARWVMRLDGDALDEAARHELECWLEADSRHRGAFVRAQAMWVDLDRVAALDAGRVPASGRAQPASWLRAAAVAALVVGVVLGAAGLGERYLFGRESTQIGEVRRLTLEDGSALALNTASIVQVRFGEDSRRVVLRRGEASFQVKHDRERPFVVEAGEVRVRAVGTAFTVRMRPDDVEVIVTEGIVEVQRAGVRERIGPQRLVRNQEVVIGAPDQVIEVAALSEQQIARRLAWHDGRLVFDGEALATAVAEVNRYAALPVVIDDPVLARRAFVGVFRVGDSRAFAQAAAAAFDAQVRERDGALHLEQ